MIKHEYVFCPMMSINGVLHTIPVVKLYNFSSRVPAIIHRSYYTVLQFLTVVFIYLLFAKDSELRTADTPSAEQPIPGIPIRLVPWSV